MTKRTGHRGGTGRRWPTAALILALAAVMVPLGGSAAGATQPAPGFGWQVVPSVPVTEGQFLGIACPGAGTCLVVGATGSNFSGGPLLYVTTDGGRTWKDESTNFPRGTPPVNAIACPAINECVAATDGGDGAILESTDGGALWQWREQGTPVSAVDCPTASVCFAGGGNGLLESTDGGVTWTTHSSFSASNLACPTTTTCYGAWFKSFSGGPAPSGGLAITHDGGQTTTYVPGPAPPGYWGVGCASVDTCFVSSQNGGPATPWFTNDAGATWHQSVGGGGTAPRAYACVTSSWCLMVGAASNGAGVWTTDDAGNSWQPQYLPAGMAAASGAACPMIDSCFVIGTSAVAAEPAYTVMMQMTGGPVVGMTSGGSGYWLASDTGAVSTHSVSSYGSVAGYALGGPVVAMVPAPDGGGYWLVCADGGVFAFGDAPYLGSMGGRPLAAPVVGAAATADGKGYWLVAADGGVFAFGDARFHGSMGGRTLNAPMVGMAADTATGGYWLVASDGGVFAFGAPFRGSAGALHLSAPVVAMAPSATGGGYWLAASDGGVFAYGDARFHGSMGGRPLNAPVVGMAADTATGGYWLVASDGGVFAFDAPFDGSD
jgi:hypothetical protein